jgi:hypothetical protein
VDAHFGEAYFGLQHLLPEEREMVREIAAEHGEKLKLDAKLKEGIQDA